jgi:hypothetical protein
MESAQYAIFGSLSGSLIADYSNRVRGLTFASNNRGWAECSAFVPMGLDEAFSLYDHAGLLSVQITDSATGTIYAGRLEDVALSSEGVTLTALGYSRALSDAPYTALWSDDSVASWRPVKPEENAIFIPERFQFDTNNRLYIALQKGAVYGNAPYAVGGLAFVAPSGSSRSILGISFDFALLAPVGWLARLITYNGSFAPVAGPWQLAATGALQTGCVFTSWAPPIDRLDLDLLFNAAPAAYAGETGAAYLKVTNVRVVSSIANQVSTVLTITRAAGVNVTATVASTARMYVGQRLIISSGFLVNESVVVLSIGSSTTFNATFVNAQPFNATVQSFLIYADEIADDLITTTAALNAGQLSSSTALTDSPGLDLLNEVYQDRLPADILDYLTSIGDTSARAWEWGVSSSQRLYFRARSTQRTWYIDVSDLAVERTLDLLENSVYAVYSDANNRAVRASVTADSASVARYGLTRRAAIGVSSTSAVQASYQQAAALADRKDPRPRASVTIREVFDAGGSRHPLWAVMAGDTMIIRNLSPTLSTTLDRVRSFRLARVSYAFDTDTLQLEPEVPRASLEALLAQQALKG